MPTKKDFIDKKFKCIHRHYWPEHKSCFAKGLIVPAKREKKLKKPVEIQYAVAEETKPEIEQWYEQLKIGYLDIETDNLYADFGTMLSWCIKEKEGPVYSDVILKDDLFNGRFDKRLVMSLLERMKDFNIIVGYYSTGFDIPYIRAKALHYGLDFPGFISYADARGNVKTESEVYHWDLYYTVKSKLRLSRKSLDNACDYLGIVGKTPIDKDIWRRAKYGEPEAISVVLQHNIGDVVILEELHNKLTNFRKWIKKGI
jgi:uncharacterized protein YprB with RNaseH-like and TPR domain